MKSTLRLGAHPIIAAVRELDDLPLAGRSPIQVAFLMTGDALTVAGATSELQHAGKQVVLHIDLIKGIAADKAGVQYLARVAHPEAIVSTKLHVLQAARKEGLGAVLHLFAIDTQAFDTGVRHAKEFGPDAVEIMPGLMPRVLGDFRKHLSVPIVAAGLIRSFSEVQQALDAGATAVVVGAKELWDLRLE